MLVSRFKATAVAVAAGLILGTVAVPVLQQGRLVPAAHADILLWLNDLFSSDTGLSKQNQLPDSGISGGGGGFGGGSGGSGGSGGLGGLGGLGGIGPVPPAGAGDESGDQAAPKKTVAQIAQEIADGTVGVKDAVIAADNDGIDMTALIGALAANSEITNAELNEAIATAVGRGYDQAALVREATRYRSAYSYTSGTGGMTRTVGGNLNGLSGTNSGGGGEGTIDCTRASPTDPLPEGC